MPRTPRRRIGEGIYVDRYSLTAQVRVNGRTREKAFPRDEPTAAIQKWRAQERARLLDEAPAPGARGTFAGDVRAYLARAASRPASLASKRSELRAWAARFGTRPRHRITPADIDTAIASWLEAGVAPKTVVNRCRTLRHLFVTLADDRRARTPLDNVHLPTVPERRPAFVDAATIAAVEIRLRAGRPIDRARYMVLVSTGIRPSQLGRVTRTDVDLERGLVVLAGGKGGRPIVYALNADMRAAWRAFVDADAFGPIDTSRLVRICRRAGWPAGVRLYNAKHSIGIELVERGADLADIQQWFGHTSPGMTRTYTGMPIARLRDMAARLDGRLGWGTDAD